MNTFTYSYPTKVYFGEKAAEKHLPAELAKVGPNVLLAYGGGSIKRNGIYDELLCILKDAGNNQRQEVFAAAAFCAAARWASSSRCCACG